MGLDAACEWYGSLMPDWTIDQADGRACITAACGTYVGSIEEAQAGAAPGWTIIVSVPDAAAAAAATEAAGGSSEPAGEGAMRLTDPTGATMCVHEVPAARHRPLFEEQPPSGVVNWADLLADDGDEARLVRHYSDVLGWASQEPVEMPGGIYVTMLDARGVRNRDKMCGVLPRKLLAPFLDSPTWLPFFSVGDKAAVEGKLAAVADAGGEARFGPFPADGWVGIVQDPAGGTFGIYSREDPWNEVKQVKDIDNSTTVHDK